MKTRSMSVAFTAALTFIVASCQHVPDPTASTGSTANYQSSHVFSTTSQSASARIAKKRTGEKKRRLITKSIKRAEKRTLVAYVAAGHHVKTTCFPRQLKSILSKVRKKYGTTPIVSSGYRSPSHNRRVGGARKSMHMKCMAADIKVPGVNKYHLAKYLKTLKGVGGVGTYGCNASVHVDVGPKRSWHWRCSKRRRG